jgi:phosphoglycolate phosphatase (TIGR01487 family)
MSWLPDGWIPKAIAVDIDGTLTDEDKVLHTGAIRALRKLEAAGISVILCTGNVRAIVYGLWRFINLSGVMVCENGGVVWHPDSEPLIRADGGKAKDAAKWLSTKIEGLDAQGITTNAWRESEWCLKSDEDLSAIRDRLANSEWSNLSVVRTGFAIHLMEPWINKGEGLAKALEIMNISPRDVLAIGDAPNDISMFELVHHSIAVGGSFSALKQVANIASDLPHGATIEPVINEIIERLRA